MDILGALGNLLKAGQQNNQSRTNGITGAINPLGRHSAPIIYSPGEGLAVPSAATQKAADQAPDITFNPNPNTNIPYTAHSVADAKLGNQYVTNPTAPQFLGVDPARFGFPADNTQGFKPVQGAGAIGAAASQAQPSNNWLQAFLNRI